MRSSRLRLRIPPSRAVLDAQPGFGGGLNLSADEFGLAEDELRRCENGRVEDAVLRKRRGTRLTAAALAAAPVRGGYGWVRPGASNIELALCNGQLFTGTYGLPMTWTGRTGAFNAAAVPAFAQFHDASADVCYIADGGPLNKVTPAGTVTVNLANTPNASGILVYNQRLVAWGDPAAPSTAYVSGFGNGDTLGDPTAVGASGGPGAAFVVETYGEREIVAAGVAQGTLFLFHPTGISIFTGITLDDISIGSGTTGLTPDIGAAAPRSVVPLDMGVAFLSDRGFCLATPAGVQPISTKLDTVLREMDQTNWARVWGVHARRRREVWWMLPGVGVYAWNYRTGAWFGPWTGAYLSPETHALWESEDTLGRPIVLRGTQLGEVEVCDYALPSTKVLDRVASNGTGGTAYTLAAECHRLVHEDVAQGKSYRQATILADLASSMGAGISYSTGSVSGVVTLSPQVGGRWGESTWGGTTWGAYSYVPYVVPIEGQGPYLTLTISDGGDRESAWSSVAVRAFLLNRRAYA